MQNMQLQGYYYIRAGTFKKLMTPRNKYEAKERVKRGKLFCKEVLRGVNL